MKMFNCMKNLTQKLRAQTLNEVQPYHDPQVPPKEFGCNSDSEEENHEIEHFLEERKPCNITSGFPIHNNNNVTLSHTPKPLRPLEDSSISSTENIQNQTTVERDRHSSEDELACLERRSTEKRKYAQVQCSWGLGGEVCWSSSDEEVKELLNSKSSPVQFSSSPPRNVQKLVRRTAESNSLYVANVMPSGDCSQQPRKRHKSGYSTSSLERHFSQSGRCLDFEKMQQKSFLKRSSSHGHFTHPVKGARVVRIKSITLNNMSRVPPRLLCDPAVFSFKSLSTINPLTPVEDPATVAALQPALVSSH